MKWNKQLIKSELKKLKESTYYRQRFDACPHFMFFLGDAHASDIFYSKYPIGQRFTCAYFSENKADWLHSFSELEFTSKEIQSLAKTNQKIADEMINEFKPFEEQFYAKCKEIDTIKLNGLSNEELINLYQELAKVYLKKLNPSPLIDGFALTTDTVLSQEIELFLENKGELDKFVPHFETLTAPTFLSFLQQEEVDFLKLVQNSEDALNNHQQKYFWIHNNYVKDKVLSLDFFTSKLKQFQNIDINKKLTKLQELTAKNTLKKDELIEKLNLPQNIVTLLKITDRFSYWQDERKKGTFWATHYFSLLLEEVARRTKYSLNDLKYVMPPEMKEIFTENIDQKILHERYNGCFLAWEKDQFDIITNQTVIKSIMNKESEHIDKEIRGMSVSLGKATGPVKIVKSVEEISKVKKGDILVAVMTRPDYIMAMEKAVGFITEEGGLTCHAAIIAREMGIPCIVGTRIATEVLKDGDIVELDANHGVIRVK